MLLEEIVNLDKHPLTDVLFTVDCFETLNETGVLVLPDFIQESALAGMLAHAKAERDHAYFCTQTHSVYLTPPHPEFNDTHPANRLVTSSKGCICDDQVDDSTALRGLYDAPEFRRFIARVTGQKAVHAYADPLSSINVHYAENGQELGWHFDNSSFAITLLIQKPEAGSRFEYIKDLRDADAGEMNYAGVAKLLNGKVKPEELNMEPGTLVLFRGRNSIHRVSPNESDTTRILAVLAYNSEPGVALSESARITFYGRRG
ncbi:MAG: 2OG-Fe(II) oxygenase [Paracoccaceae bacterium]